MKRISILLCALFALLISQTAASSGLLFNVSATGTPANLNITLCLNGNASLSCQNYTVSALNLSISTTIPRHVYPAVGIKVNTPGYVLAGCTPIANGNCLFSANSTTSTSIVASSTSAFFIGGTVSDLSGAVVLQNNSGNSQTISSNGPFTFSTSLTTGEPYAVTVLTQPANQTCTVANGSGIIGSANVTNVIVTCSINTFTLTVITGVNGTISPSGSVILSEGSSQTFTATPSAYYAVTQWLLDGSLVQTGGNIYTLSNVTANHTVEATFGQATLTPSVASLALSVNCPTAGGSCAYSNAALTGNPRQITIINNGSVAATNVSVVSTGFPSGTSISNSTCGSTLNAGASCTITITPGQIATSTCTLGTAPSNGTVTVSSDDAISSVIDVVVLGYGCRYQSGYLYSVDDSYTNYPQSNSIGGKIAALSDNSLGIYWDSSTACVSSGTCYTTNADSGINGSNLQTPPGNTYLIYQVLTTTHAESASSYAAGLCTVYTAGGYTDWYSPAICEMGYGGSDSPYFNCGTQSIPALQNMQSNLAANNIGGLTGGGVNGFYWSSTEDAQAPTLSAWVQHFDSSSNQFSTNKDIQLGVRCSRALTL